MYHRYEDNTAVVKDERLHFPPDSPSSDGEEFRQWLTDTNTTLQELPTWPPMTNQQRVDKMVAWLNRYMDSKANERQPFVDRIDCLSFLTSNNANWRANAQAFRDWRDALLTYALGVYQDVLAGTIPMPEPADFLVNAPVLVWAN